MARTQVPSPSRPPVRRRWAAFCRGGLGLLAALGGAPAAAQEGSDEKEAVAVRITGDGVRVDGRLDDAAWARAVFLNDFRQRDPNIGAPASDRTEVAFLYDDDALFVAARMYSADPGRMPTGLTRRDGFGNAEHVTILLDAFMDRRTAYAFTVTSGNGRRDYYFPRDADDNRDFNWNPVWEGSAAVDSLGWTAEFRIPFSQLRYEDRAVQVWGLNINRWIPQRNEDIYWVVVPRNVPGFISHFGTLSGIEGIPAARRMELLPYVAANTRLTGRPVPGNPFNDGSVHGASVGADFKVGLGPSLTVDATINPDFGQVDADPAEVNLSAFETFFPERRPFFTEGNQALSGGSESFFYSRRVGAPPRGPASGDFVDRPGNTRILGAAKLTGRVGTAWQLGLFTAVTERTYATTWDSTARQYGDVEVEPLATFGAGRLQRQFGASGSTIGFTLAGQQRMFSAGSALADRFSRQSLAGGADWALRFQGGAYTVSGRFGASFVGGTTAAILRLQQSSARYFQRPDASHVEVDPTATSLVGFSAGFRVSKNSGTWLWGAGVDTDSPGFETNDTGRLQNGDDIGASADLTRRQTEPSAVFRRSRLNLSVRSGWNYGGVRRDAQVRLASSATFLNYVEANLNLQHNPRVTSDNLTRGGPLMQTGWRNRVDGSVGNGGARSTTFRLNGVVEWGEFGAWNREVELRVGVNPSPTTSLSVNPGYQRRVSARQYVGRYGGGSALTYGERYVFARIERSEIAMQVRVNYLFSPTLSLEAYGEPFSSSGRYFGFGELAAAGSRFLREYGVAPGTTIIRSGREYRVTDSAVPGSFAIRNPDFNSISFRSNLVIRWEWNPGSTIFFVWQQNRSEFCSGGSVDACPNGSAPGSLPTVGSFADPFQVPGDNFVAVKVSYWIPVR